MVRACVFNVYVRRKVLSIFYAKATIAVWHKKILFNNRIVEVRYVSYDNSKLQVAINGHNTFRFREAEEYSRFFDIMCNTEQKETTTGYI